MEQVYKTDFKNELGTTFEKYSGILISNILKKENNTYFNIKFDIIEAINNIKSKISAKIPLEEEDKDNEFAIYKEIKSLIKICNTYKEKLKNLSKSSNNNNIDSMKCFSENKINIFENKDNISNNNKDTPKKSEEENTINSKNGSEIDKIKLNSDNSSYTSGSKKTAKKKEKKNLNKGEIDVLITNVKREEFLNLINEKYLKFNKFTLPENFNIIVEACLNLSNQIEEKKIQIKKYRILTDLINDLYNKKPEYLNDYLCPFYGKYEMKIFNPNFVYIITTNSVYDYFIQTSRKFFEEKKNNQNLNLFILYIKFNLVDKNFGLANNNLNDIKELMDELKIQKQEIEKINKLNDEQNQTIKVLKNEIDNLKKSNLK